MNTPFEVTLKGTHVAFRLTEALALEVLGPRGELLWASAGERGPAIVVAGRELALRTAARRTVEPFESGPHRGQRVALEGFPDTDVRVELRLGVDAGRDELLAEIEQAGGKDVVSDVRSLWCLEKPVRAGGYLVLPHGSGYLVPADWPGELPGTFDAGGIVGGRWMLPLFGMTAGDYGLRVIVDTWWDCDVAPAHRPGKWSRLEFNWVASLGRLGYARRQRIRVGRGLDYAAMAKEYRDEAKRQGLLRTLAEKMRETPVIRRYVDGVLFRWPAWEPRDGEAVLADLRELRAMGFGVNFFFPKWPSAGYSPERNTATTCNGNWQAYLHPTPVPGGWEALASYGRKVRDLGGTIQGFINPRSQYEDSPEYDETRFPRNAAGETVRDLSASDAMARMIRVLDNARDKGHALDVMYYDGYSAYYPLPEDFTPGRRISRRQSFEAQNAVFAETRRRGIMPGAELARFWCMAECDYFFFTDWSCDRLTDVPTRGAPAPAGVPVPLFQLVFHDGYVAGFSGGGYALYTAGYDWWWDRTPRLYELLFASAPAHNWLPNGFVPVRDWDDPEGQARWAWLKRWSAYYRRIAEAEMVEHRFVGDWEHQRIAFANGVTVEFDLAANRCRVGGVEGFSGEWEAPAGELGYYPCKVGEFEIKK